MKSRSSRRSRRILIKRWQWFFNSSKPCQNPVIWCSRSSKNLEMWRMLLKIWQNLWRSKRGMKTNRSRWRGGFVKYPKALKGNVSATTRQYLGHVLGLVKSYWPRTPLDLLGQGAKADCTDDQFNLYLQETSAVADKIVETLNKSGSPWTIRKIVWRLVPQVLCTNV